MLADRQTAVVDHPQNWSGEEGKAKRRNMDMVYEKRGLSSG